MRGVAAALGLIATALLSAGCISGSARSCQKEQGFSGETLIACERGYAKVAPYHDDARDAQAVCERERDACIKLLYADTLPDASPETLCRVKITEPFSLENEAWFEQANRVASEFNGCRAGVLGYFDDIYDQVHPQGEPVGCYMEVGVNGQLRCIDSPGAHPRYAD